MSKGIDKAIPVKKNGEPIDQALVPGSPKLGIEKRIMVDQSGIPIDFSGGEGTVDSVNGQTGTVVLSASDVNAYNKSEIDIQQSTQDDNIDLNTTNITNLGDEVVSINQNIANLQPYFENINVAGPIAIGSTETELFNITLTKTGNYLGNLNVDYTDSSLFNQITYNLYINNVLVSGRNYSVAFDVGGAGYTLANIISVNAGDIVSIKVVLGSGSGSLSNISAFLNKVA